MENTSTSAATCTAYKALLTTTAWKQCEKCRERARIASARYRRTHLAAVADYAREYQPAWRRRQIEKNPEYLLREAAKLRRGVFLRKLKKYDLTEAQYNEMAAKGCAICGGPPRGRGRYNFDHNPLTGKFRGLLCAKCNPALGLFNEDSKLLICAAGYLAAHVE